MCLCLAHYIVNKYSELHMDTVTPLRLIFEGNSKTRRHAGAQLAINQHTCQFLSIKSYPELCRE